MVVLRTWIRNKVVFYLQGKTLRRMGSSRWIDDDQIRRKRTPSFPSHESVVSRNAQEQRRWKIIYTLLCRWGHDWDFFAQSFLLISSVSTEQSQICVKNTNLAMIEHGDLLWQDNLTHCSCQVWWRQTCLWPMILRKKNNHCKDTKNERKGFRNKIVWLRFVLMQDFWQQLESDSTSWQRTLNNSHNVQRQWHVVSIFCQEMKNHLTRKVGFEGTPKLGTYWKSQPPICKVNWAWNLELNL